MVVSIVIRTYNEQRHLPELLVAISRQEVDFDYETVIVDSGSTDDTLDIAVEFGRLGPNPLPIKTAMAVCGLLQEEFRLPMCPLGADAGRLIAAILKRHELPELAKTRVPERVS